MTALPASSAQALRFDLPAGRKLTVGERPLLMGVVNVTPDSFSDGGRFLEPRRAAEHALSMLEDGADIIDLGAESTRPGGGIYGSGADEVSAPLELQRLLPVLRRLRVQTEAPISIDTRKASVARAALGEGADLINDISALADPDMGPLVAQFDVPIVLMHCRGEIRSMQTDIRFDNVVLEVRNELLRATEQAIEYGIRREQILVDPGIGFGKTVEQNVELLRHIDVLAELGRPVVIGASRKSFLGVLDGTNHESKGASWRLGGGLAVAAWTAAHGATVIRTHDVAATAQYFRLWSALNPSALNPVAERMP